jgi:hypothetical protein
MTATAISWDVEGEYFENCNCDVVCPCEISPKGFLQAVPDRGVCDVLLVFHVNAGHYGETDLTGGNLILAAHAPGIMAEGNWTVAVYVDSRASTPQQQALGAIFGGAAGGPLSALAPLIGSNAGIKAVPIEYRNEGRQRSARIEGILDARVEAVPGASPDALVVKQGANPLFPAEWIQAYGVQTTYRDYEFNWDNTGRCADYAAFRWSGP